MAYITAERTKEIKRELKAAFPNLTCSVRNEHHSSVNVSIMAGNIDFSEILEGRDHAGINHYWIKQNYPKHSNLLNAIFEIVNKGNYDRSDIMTDYFDVGFYVHMEIGRWDKPYIYKGAK